METGMTKKIIPGALLSIVFMGCGYGMEDGSQNQKDDDASHILNKDKTGSREGFRSRFKLLTPADLEDDSKEDNYKYPNEQGVLRRKERANPFHEVMPETIYYNPNVINPITIEPQRYQMNKDGAFTPIEGRTFLPEELEPFSSCQGMDSPFEGFANKTMAEKAELQKKVGDAFKAAAERRMSLRDYEAKKILDEQKRVEKKALQEAQKILREQRELVERPLLQQVQRARGLGYRKYTKAAQVWDDILSSGNPYLGDVDLHEPLRIYQKTEQYLKMMDIYTKLFEGKVGRIDAGCFMKDIYDLKNGSDEKRRGVCLAIITDLIKKHAEVNEPIKNESIIQAILNWGRMRLNNLEVKNEDINGETFDLFMRNLIRDHSVVLEDELLNPEGDPLELYTTQMKNLEGAQIWKELFTQEKYIKMIESAVRTLETGGVYFKEYDKPIFDRIEKITQWVEQLNPDCHWDADEYKFVSK